ncbi:MAG: NF038143 family protein [Oceanidesulfovibrio sp.]
MTLDEKRDLILAHEQAFARRMANKVVGNPSIHVWMILIPVIFVFHFFKLNQAKEGRKQFAEGYMQSRRHTLDAVWERMRAGDDPLTDNDVDPALVETLCAGSATPKPAMDQYRAFIRLLAEHYADLLRASGESAEELIRSVYRNRSNYLLFLRQMGAVEHTFNEALRPHLPEELDETDDLLQFIERTAKELRKEQAESIFA